MCTVTLRTSDESEQHKYIKAETVLSTCETPIHASTEINLGICLVHIFFYSIKDLMGRVITLWKSGAHNRGKLDMC